MTIALPLLSTDPVRPNFAMGPKSLDAVRLLRMSVTDRCNLRCMYCMPAEGVAFDDAADLLRAEEYVAIAEACASIGVTHFKLTGGEPTVRRDLIDIVRGIAALQPADLSLTTNGLTLARQAHDLRRAGLDRLTVSWDSMRPQRVARIAGAVARHAPDSDALARGRTLLNQLQSGLEAAQDAGFDRLKLNVVVIGGINDDEVVDFARLTMTRNWTVRFIEYMPLGSSTLADDAVNRTIDNAEILARISAVMGTPTPIHRENEPGVGPAEVYRLPGAIGRIGFISAMSQPFCETCNRMRLTARGEFRGCLFDGGEVSVLPALRPTPNREQIVSLMARSVSLKPDTHSNRGNRAMSQLGG